MISKELRTRAESVLKMARRDVDALQKQDVQHVVYELQVHQVELDMQNETLRGAQRALEESYAQYRELFECAPVGYVTLDNTGRIVQANAAAATLLRAPRAKLFGQRPHASLAREDWRGLDQQLAGVSQRSSTTCEVRVKSTDMPAVHLRLDISIPHSNNLHHLIALTDISNQRRNTEALESSHHELEARVAARTAELAARNAELETQIAATIKSEAERRELEKCLREAERFQSLSVLAGGIAHDFNNLLVAVLGNAELLLVAPDLSEKWRESLILIKRGAQQAADLTRQLLVFAGQGQVTMSALRLPKLVTECLELLRSRLPPGVQLQAQITADLPEVQADRAQVSQVVMNLVVNAIEAVSGTGVISVQTRAVWLDADMLKEFQHSNTAQPGHFVILQVRDSGPGISGATLARIFDPFFSTKFAGRGLGLASVLGIVQSHHGALSVNSVVGVGSSFEIAFPAALPRVESEIPRAHTPSTWKGSGRVLLIDDDDGVRRVVAMLLAQLGFDVTAASDGEAGLELFRHAHAPFRLVVLDWIMPGFSGEQTLAALREQQPELPIILISGYSAQDLSSYDARAVCVQKPMTMSQLRSAVRQLLGQTVVHN